MQRRELGWRIASILRGSPSTSTSSSPASTKRTTQAAATGYWECGGRTLGRTTGGEAISRSSISTTIRCRRMESEDDLPRSEWRALDAGDAAAVFGSVNNRHKGHRQGARRPL